MIGARKKDVEAELGIDLCEEKESANTAEIFKHLKVRKEQVPLKSLLSGEFPRKSEHTQDSSFLDQQENLGPKW